MFTHKNRRDLFWNIPSLPWCCIDMNISWYLMSKTPSTKYAAYGHDDILYHFFIWLVLLPVLLSSIDCFPLRLSLYYILSIWIFLNICQFLFCLLILLSSCAYLFNHQQAQDLFLWRSLTTWAATIPWNTTLRTSNILSFTFTSFSFL